MASVVRYFGGVKLGAGGLVRAYTDAVAQALLKAEKVPLISKTTLVCTVPYALEGMVRREVDLAKAQLLKVEHSSGVCLTFSLPQSEAESMVVRLNDLGHGQLGWSDPDLLT